MDAGRRAARRVLAASPAERSPGVACPHPDAGTVMRDDERTGDAVEETEARASARTKRSFDRFVNFSDAVFAIAITLLALDIRLPQRDAGVLAPPLGPQLQALQPNLFAFVLSFAVIGGYWIAHHRVFGMIDRHDGQLIGLNMLTLFCVVLLPFPTQVVADYGDTTLGVEIYAGAMVLTGMSILALSLYARRSRLVAAEADIRKSIIRSSFTPSVFAASMIVAVWSPQVAMYMWILAAVIHVVADPIVDRLAPAHTTENVRD
jgi:TMEM175 potassium channel family protein